MAVCEVCGNDYDQSMEIVVGGETHVSDAFECASHLLAPSGATAPSAAGPARRWRLKALAARGRGAWSSAATIRAVRAAVVMPALFALSLEVIGNRQVATYAAFGAFATLVLAGFGGSTRDKLIAHGQLAVVGSGLVIVGTAVGSSTALAAAVALPVTFAVFFAGMAGPNAASAVTAALLAFVLPASSPGTIGMVPDRVAGWLLASVAGTLAVLLLPTPQGGSGLRAAISKLAATLADDVEVLARRRGADQQEPSAAIEAKRELLAEFHSTPYSPTG